MLNKIILTLLLSAPCWAANQVSMQSLTTASVSTSSISVASASHLRRYLIVQNRGTVDCYLKFDSAHSGTEGLLLQANGVYEPYVVPTNEIYMKCALGTQSISVYEGR